MGAHGEAPRGGGGQRLSVLEAHPDAGLIDPAVFAASDLPPKVPGDPTEGVPLGGSRPRPVAGVCKKVDSAHPLDAQGGPGAGCYAWFKPLSRH
jgi:hypothetical protein